MLSVWSSVTVDMLSIYLPWWYPRPDGLVAPATAGLLKSTAVSDMLGICSASFSYMPCICRGGTKHMLTYRRFAGTVKREG
jgi:hypothetical protein